ncbi:polyphosphate kinase 2 family protein [Larkinella terrae]|uniref:polyphosphate kinase 2 family protein n=1 Tax=Larkinella terrae TaxID=2025311 RepID=UPI001E3074E1|nr:polyphosphate kinase 2 family protein [Larkinella terrae]
MNTTNEPLHLKTEQFRFTGSPESGPFSISDFPTKIDDLYESKEHYETLLSDLTSELNDLQEKMYAHNRYGLVTIFQAMDAAGKDSTIQHVFSGVNPLGLRVHSFKRPTDQELDHDFLWRNLIKLPERGTIGIFNRSYYEEVLVVKVHPEILTKTQRLPEERTADLDKVWKQRYKDICHFETYLNRNGFPVLKFFLHVSKKEQGDRLIDRIEDPSKNWKFDDQDVVERGFWKQYMQAYEDAINATATKKAPWYVIPADDKKNMRLIVAKILVEELKTLKIEYPKVNKRQQKSLQDLLEVIKKE